MLADEEQTLLVQVLIIVMMGCFQDVTSSLHRQAAVKEFKTHVTRCHHIILFCQRQKVED